MRLIDADEVQSRIDLIGTVNGILCWDAHDFIDHVPTSAYVKHGHWYDNGEDKFICSVCGGSVWRWFGRSDYCPRCGAVMDEEDTMYEEE